MPLQTHRIGSMELRRMDMAFDVLSNPTLIKRFESCFKHQTPDQHVLGLERRRYKYDENAPH